MIEFRMESDVDASSWKSTYPMMNVSLSYPLSNNATVDDVFDLWKRFMSACGYGVDRYELVEGEFIK